MNKKETILGMPVPDTERTGLNKPEAPPESNDHPAVWDQFFRRFITYVDLGVANDIEERDRAGELKYGVRLQPFNGRDPEVDLYQELLDAIVYAMQSLLEAEENHHATPWHHERIVRLVSLANETRAFASRKLR